MNYWESVVHEVAQLSGVEPELPPGRSVGLQHFHPRIQTSRRSGWPGGVRPGPPASLFAKCSAQMSLDQSSSLTTFSKLSRLPHSLSSPSWIFFFILLATCCNVSTHLCIVYLPSLDWKLMSNLFIAIFPAPGILPGT